ncbi:MAG TPA: YciI family protein [Terracidiphilus sp.]|nr:YciI family protein [Terracidiphilus sp.]
MQYMLLAQLDETQWPKMTKEQQEQGTAAYFAFTEALTKAGALKASGRLRPSSDSTTVRVANGKAQVLDGPFIDSKEQLAGYFLIDVPDLDAALKWAERCPASQHGVVEVRPLWVMTPSAVAASVGD